MKKNGALFVFVFLVSTLFARDGFFSLRTDLNLGFNGGPTASYFAADTIDRFGSNWRALQIPLETARNYEESISPFFALTFGAGYKNFSMWITLNTYLIKFIFFYIYLLTASYLYVTISL